MKKLLITLFVIVITIAIIIVTLKFIGSRDAGDPSQAQQMPPPAVSVLEIRSQKINLTETLPGRITAFRQAEIRPQVNGIIIERLFEEGSTVEKGQQLYQIDDAPYKAQLSSAEADLKSANASIESVRARAERFEKLQKSNSISKQEYDDALAQLAQAKANIAVAQAAVDVANVNLNYTKVYAPISGHISKSFVTEGALVTANQQQHLAVITQLNPIYADLTQSSTEMMAMRQNLQSGTDIPVTLSFENSAVPYKETGKLQFSDVTVGESTGSVQLRAIFPNPDGLLLPGLFIRATVNLGEKDVILVPQQAAIRNPDGSLVVWVVNGENKVAPVPVTVSGAYQHQWIIASGLEQGTRIVVEGFQKIAPDAVVTPILWKADQPQGRPAPQQGQKAEQPSQHPQETPEQE